MKSYFREFLTFVITLIVIFWATAMIGCGGVSVREPEVYEAEIEFVQAASDESVERLKALIEDYCVCQEGEFIHNVCEDAADTALVIESRMGYHLDFMLYLGGISEERPPKDPPEIPEIPTLCPHDVEINVPTRDEDAGGE